MDTMLKEIGKRVRDARHAKNMSQAQLAAALHVSVPYISHIEQGKQAMSVTTLSGICNLLEVSADWVIRNKSPESRRIVDDEILHLLAECSVDERTAILKMVKCMRDALKGWGIDRDGQ